MRPGSLLPLLALGPVARVGAAASQESRHLAVRDLELLNSRDLDQLSPPEVELLTRALVERGLLDDIWQKFKDATTCAGGEVRSIVMEPFTVLYVHVCDLLTMTQTLLGALKVLAFFGDGAFVKVIQGICKLAKVSLVRKIFPLSPMVTDVGASR